MSRPQVTVLMAVHNGLPQVRRGIDSILAQDFRDFEFLIVDDGSTDGTGRFLAGVGDPRVRTIRVGHRGLAGALNLGLAEARAPLVARQDDDDVSRPERLGRQVAAFAEEPELVLVGADFWFADLDGGCLRVGTPPRTDLRISWTLLFRNVFSHGSAMFRREAATALGGYRPLARSQDYDLWARLSRAGRVGVVPEVLYHWTQDPRGLSGPAGKALQDRLASEAAVENLRETLRGRLPADLEEPLRVLGNGREWEVPPRVAPRLALAMLALERAFLARRSFPEEDRMWLRAEVRRRIAKLAVRSGPAGAVAVVRTLAADPLISWQYLLCGLRATVLPPPAVGEAAP